MSYNPSTVSARPASGNSAVQRGLFSRAKTEDMSRAVPFSTSFLVGACVFAWLAGPVLETRFGTEALLATYAGVAVGTAATTYVVVRRLDAQLTGPTSNQTKRAENDRHASDEEGDGQAATVTLSLDDLDVEREVRQLKAEQPGGSDED